MLRRYAFYRQDISSASKVHEWNLPSAGIQQYKAFLKSFEAGLAPFINQYHSNAIYNVSAELDSANRELSAVARI